MVRITSASALIVLAAGLAHGQITVTSQTRWVQAVAGNGSGTNFLESLNFDAWNRSVSKTWGVGSNFINQQSTMTPWTLDCEMIGENAANSDGEAGSIASRYRIDFTVSSPIDVYSDGFFTGDNISGGSMRLWNRTTNGTILGPGNSYQHLPAGQYAFEQNISQFTRGMIEGNMAIQFRPGNDQCQYATVVTNKSYIGTTTTASGTGDGPASCNTPAFPDAVWFKYTAPYTGPLVLSTCGSSFDTVLTVFNNGNCILNANNILACNDDAPAGANCGAGSNASNVTVNVTAGQQLMVRLSGYNDATGDYRFNVGPVNDNCNSMIPALLGDNAFDNRLADTDGSIVNSCVFSGDNQINGDLWYSFVPATSGLLTLDTCGSSFDTKLVIYDGYSCGASGYMACNDDSATCGGGNNLRSKISDLPVVAGHNYTIRVGGFSTNRGAGNLRLSMPPACPADFNQDGVVDFFDYLDFVDAFAANTPTSDFNSDSVVDFFDYLDFVDAFAAGC